LRSSELPDGTWPIDDDLFDSLAGLLDDEIDTTGQDSNDYISDLESCGHSQGTKDVRVKLERGSKGAKKRKFNPDSDVIAAATDETLKQLDIDPNSKEGKAKRRQIRNRLSAQFHRDRKNAHLNTMEQQLANKDMEIASLKEQVTMLLAENEYLRKLHPGFVSALLLRSLTTEWFPGYDRKNYQYVTTTCKRLALSSIYCSGQSKAEIGGLPVIAECATQRTLHELRMTCIQVDA
jgi:hypothetical protein